MPRYDESKVKDLRYFFYCGGFLARELDMSAAPCSLPGPNRGGISGIIPSSHHVDHRCFEVRQG